MIRQARCDALLVASCFALFLLGCGKQGVEMQADAADDEQVVSKGEKSEDGGKRTKDEASPGRGFRFAEDRTGALLAAALSPADTGRRPITEKAKGPRPSTASSAVEQPTLPLPASGVTPLRLPLDFAKSPVRPAALPEDFPLLEYRGNPSVPDTQHLAAGDRRRLPSPKVDQPLLLPHLAQAVPDRAPLDDPTLEVSFANAQSAPPPARLTPAPFLRLNLPDPFENRLQPDWRRAEEESLPLMPAPRSPR